MEDMEVEEISRKKKNPTKYENENAAGKKV